MPSKLPQHGVRAPREILDKLKYIAEYNGRSGNQEIVHLIRVHIREFEKKHGPIPINDDEERE